MLIRSQDNNRLINIDNVYELRLCVYAQGYGITDCVCSLGKYSTEEKAIKVLDMIQKVYANSEIVKGIIPEIGKALKEAPLTKENELLTEALGEELGKKMIFQMPQDSEVKVDG